MGRTLPYTPSRLSSVVADALSNAAVHARSGLRYPLAKTASDKTDETRFALATKESDLLYERVVCFAMEWAVEKVGGLNVGINMGCCRKPDGTIVEYAGTNSLAIAASKTGRKLYYNFGTSAIVQADSWPADLTTFFPIAEIDTDGAAVLEVRSKRELIGYFVPPAAGTLTGTNDVAFVLDADNSGTAAANLQLRANRGSSDAEDAAFEWVEASGIWRARSQHTTLTRAPIDAAALWVGGSAVINTFGKLVVGAVDSAALYTFGANGATPAGLALTAAGSSGAPSSGTHAVGELHLDSVGVIWQCITAGTPGTWRRIGRSDALTFVRLDMGNDQTGAGGTKTVTIQAKDRDGASLAAVQYFTLGVWQDADGAALASSATIGTASTGTRVRVLDANKRAVYKTDANGTLTLDVTMSATETVYLLAAPCERSGYVDCSDIIALTKA